MERGFQQGPARSKRCEDKAAARADRKPAKRDHAEKGQAIEPETFTAAVDPTGERSWMELLFMSFTTLSSTGLGDVIPVKSFGRALVMIEQVVGLAFVAMLVSRLVGLTVLRGRIRRDAGDQR